LVLFTKNQGVNYSLSDDPTNGYIHSKSLESVLSNCAGKYASDPVPK